ncbi:hypothetical protein [Streptomyces sp. NPDC001927]
MPKTRAGGGAAWSHLERPPVTFKKQYGNDCELHARTGANFEF